MANAQLGENGIFFQYPPNSYKDEYPYGPMYVGLDFERSHTTINEAAPVNDYYIEDWSDGSEDRPYSLIVADGQIVVSCMLNILTMWGNGSNPALRGDPWGGLNASIDDDNCSIEYYSDAYYWAEAYVLFVDKNNLTLNNATHLGTWSGGDFSTKMRRTSDGGFAISGTVTGCPQDLTSVGEGEHGIAVKLDAAGGVDYRASASAPGGASFCAFAITEAQGGGLVLAGNSEDEGGVDHEENFCFVKFGGQVKCYDENASIVSAGDKPYYEVGLEEEWNTDQYVKTQVVVPAGHKLIIKGSVGNPVTIHFADSREVYSFDNTSGIGIKVEAGGFLSVQNATLTGWSCDDIERMWDGISVEGVEGKDQEMDAQGWCNLVSANIINARIGVAAAQTGWALRSSTDGYYDETGSTATREESPHFWHSANGKGGARILAFNTSFINNGRSAIFMKYPQHNASRFQNCDFISDDPLVGPNQIRQTDADDYGSGQPLGTHIHLSSWATNVYVYNCSFSGSTDILPDYRPHGIAGLDASFLLRASDMNTLKVGIEGTGSLGSITANMATIDTHFDNVLQGVVLKNSTADIIQNCTFDHIPTSNATNATTLTYTGIFGYGNNAGLIKNNTFSGDNPAEKSYGIVLRGTSQQGTMLKENDFNNIRYGNQFEGDNSGLLATCNTYDLIGANAWAALQQNNDGALADQGSSNSQSAKADNQFIDLCTGNDGDQHIFANYSFNYYDKTGNPHPAEAACVSDVVNFQIAFVNSNVDCQIPEPPCSPCDEKEKYLQSDRTIKDRNIALWAMIHTGVDAAGEKRPANYEDAMFVLQDRAQPEDQRLLIATLTEQGKEQEAQQLLNNYTEPVNTIAPNAFSSMVLAILEASHNGWSEPIFAENNEHTDFLIDNTPTMSMANNVRWFEQGIYTPLQAWDTEEIKKEAQNKNLRISSDPTVASGSYSVRVFPNPFKDLVHFDLSSLDEGTNYRLEVVNLLGEILWTQNSNELIDIEWHTAKLEAGTYFYTILSDRDEQVVSGKIIKL